MEREHIKPVAQMLSRAFKDDLKVTRIAKLSLHHPSWRVLRYGRAQIKD